MEHGRLLPSEPNLRAIFCQGCGMSGEAFEDLLFDFYLEYFVQSDERLSEYAKARIRDFARAQRPG